MTRAATRARLRPGGSARGPGAQGDRAPRPPRGLPLRGERTRDRARARDHLHVGHVGAGDALPGHAVHRHRAGPHRARRVGEAARRLLARRLRERRPRPDGDPRPRERDLRGALARRRGRHAARLPVPGALRAPGARGQRRPGPRGEPPAARRDAAAVRGGPAAAGEHPAARRGPLGGPLPRPARAPRRHGHGRAGPRPRLTRRIPRPGPPSCTRCARSWTRWVSG